MFAEFNDSEFPKICVKFKKNIDTEKDFYDFLSKWDSYNNKKEDYVFIFDTRTLGMVSINYAFTLKTFIYELKQKEQYLRNTIIVVNSSYIRYLLKFLFSIQSPLNRVYIVDNIEDGHHIYSCISNSHPINISDVSIVDP